MSDGAIPTLAPGQLGEPAAGAPAPLSSRRTRVARGTVINAAFLTGLTTLGLLKGFIVAGFFARSDYGVWGVLVVTLGLLGWLKAAGIGDKYVQQSETDQELAFQRAFTLEALSSGALALLALAIVPLIVLGYGSKLLAPALVALLVIPAGVLQFPLLVFYRRLDFVRQRTLQAIDPVVELAVTIPLAAAGAGYWSLIAGVLAGNYATALAVLRASPYRLAWRYDRGALQRYASFSWPLAIAGASGLIVAQSAIFTGQRALGLAGVGAISLASSIVLYTAHVDAIVTSTMYPAVCAVRDRADLLFESFAKSNRLGLMWGVPLGVGIALFTPDLVHFGIGERWRPAVTVIQICGLVAAADQLGYNWDAYVRARGDTRPIAVVAVVTAAAFLAAGIPLLVFDGLTGYGIGLAVAVAVGIAGRAYYLNRLFPAFALLPHAARAIAPTLPAAALVLALHGLEGHRTLAMALAEVVLFAVAVVAATLLLERTLLREILASLRGRQAAAGVIA